MRVQWSFRLSLWVVLAAASISSAQSEDSLLEKKFPSLKAQVPRITILRSPTAIQSLSGLAHEVGVPENSLLVKRDDQSENLLGGNKSRKLEYLIAEARSRGAKSLITSGMWGSNHALATAIAGHDFGFNVHLHLGPQPVTPQVRAKLLVMQAFGARLHYHSSTIGLGFGILKAMISDALSGGTVMHIPPGGSNPTGSLGYINAYLEMLDQLGRDGLPARIVVPVGSMGTAAGLLVGSCLAGTFEKVQIVGVGVSDPLLSGEGRTRSSARELHEFLLRKLSREERKSVPKCDYSGSDRAFHFSGDFFAPGYGAPSPETLRAIARLERTDGIHLDGTYSGKAMAWLLQDLESVRHQRRAPPRTLFWLTYNSCDLKSVIANHDWTDSAKPWLDLPSPFQWMFSESSVPRED